MTTANDALRQLNQNLLILREREAKYDRNARDYARFLDHAADLIFLQKVGGGYRFIHRLLLEHFAEMPGEGKQ